MRTLYKSIAIIVLLLAPAAVAAQTVDTAALLAQIQQLQAQIAAQLTAGSSSSAVTPPQSQSGGGGNCVALDSTLQKGDSGDDVTDLQNFLIKEGLLDTNATGFFGTLTETAVKEWQGSHGISPIGIVGPATRLAMGNCGGSSSTGAPLVSNQCPTVSKPANCANGISVQLNGCTVGWQCTVAQLPAQTFTATPVTGQAPLVVKFSGVVTSANAGFCQGNFCAATLVFGDGTTGAVPLPNAAGSALSYEISHTYQNGGNFIANLYEGSAGSGAPVVGNGIAINAIARPAPVVPGTPALTVTPNFGAAPLPVTITVSNVTSGANLSIEFGDGTFGSVQQIGANAYGATHTYTSAGSFTIKLRRTNASGDTCVSASCPIISTVGLSVNGGQVATASLAATPSIGLAPLPVTFYLNGASVSYPGGAVLDFGDGTTEIVCSANVVCSQKTTTHTYAAAGTYNVQLIAQSIAGTTVLRTMTVTANALTATTLKAEPASGPVPLAVTLTGHGGNQIYVNGAILKYGDGSSEIFCNAGEMCGQKTKTHTYVDGSQYSAQLIALNEGTASTTIGTATVTATGGTTKVKVTGPSGSARKGESVSIAWQILGTKPTAGSISFDLYTQAGSRIGTILTITDFRSGSATWKIPSSADKSCSTTQPNGLCGVILQPGMYKIIANTTGLTNNPEISSESNIDIKDEFITPGGFTLSIAPSSGEVGKPMSIKYRVANPPADAGVALWMVKPNGENVGLIQGKLEADREQTTYPWNMGETVGCVAALFNPMIMCSMSIAPLVPGTYHIFGKVYSPFNGEYVDSSKVTTHASATSTAFTMKAAGTGASCLVLNSNLQQTDTDATTGGDVSRLQRFLAEDSDIYPEGIINGVFGNATRRAVERYQASKGIASSGSPETNGYGLVGPTTRASIAANCGTNSNYLFTASPLTGRAPLAVTFTAKAIGTGAAQYIVDFGDGSSSPMTPGTNGYSITHTYPTTGTYIARLTTQIMTCSGNNCVANEIVNGGTATVRVTNVATPPPQSCADITHTLGLEDKDSMTGGDVTRLQQFLAANPTFYPEGTVTGFYGGLTSKAVARYQEANSITPTGSVGPITLAHIQCKKTPVENGIFSATPETGTAPLTVKFATDRSVTTGSYRINFGDGLSQWLTASSTTHTYPAAGAYVAELVESIGNCFGLPQDALEICEIGYRQVIATKTVTVSQQATMSVYVAPATLNNGQNLAITWSTTNAPANSKVRLEIYRDGATEAIGNNDQGVAGDTSVLGVNGTYNWTTPAANRAILADGGHSGFALAPGSYHVTAKLYTGDACWGYCASVPVRTINATAKSTSFVVTTAPVTTTTTTTGGGAVTGSVACINRLEQPMMARVTMANGATKDVEFAASGEQWGSTESTVYADFPSTPTNVTGYYASGGYYGMAGDKWALGGQNTITGRTGGSISMSFTYAGNGIVLQGRTSTCTVAWH